MSIFTYIPFVQTWTQVLKKRSFLALVWVIGAAKTAYALQHFSVLPSHDYVFCACTTNSSPIFIKKDISEYLDKFICDKINPI
jgi:hypothetical protein